MQNMKDIKRRIDSVESTQKITRAMKMVAAAKLKKSQDRAEKARPFFEKTRQILSDISQFTREVEDHPLVSPGRGDRTLFITISGDRGLCGAYNSRVIKKVEQSIANKKEDGLLVIGKKARDYFRKREYNLVSEYVEIDDYPGFDLAQKIGEEVISLFQEDVVDQVQLAYTHFNSAISQEVRLLSLLPVHVPEEQQEKEQVDYIYEPSPREILDIILPRYINNILYSSLLESRASEFGSRMTAMDSATDNAEEMIEDLTLTYNRARQAQITKEITEIVGGAEALK
ncbi:MAG: ATP synthase F1 subunit gamma [Bacillota bacterium]